MVVISNLEPANKILKHKAKYVTPVCKLQLQVKKPFQLWRNYQGADKSLARPGRKQARKHVRDARDFNKLSKIFFFLQGKAPKKIHTILVETLACFLPGRAKTYKHPSTICVTFIISYCSMTWILTSPHTSHRINDQSAEVLLAVNSTGWFQQEHSNCILITVQRDAT